MIDPQLSSLLAQFGIEPEAANAIVSGAIYFTIGTLAAAIPTGMIARRRGRSVIGWVALALSIPLLPLLAVWILPAKKQE